MEADSDVAVVGAGPYGLAAVAHLRAAGFRVHAFGRPMEFWERHMPEGMLLRSALEASQIADPHGTLTLGAFAAQRGAPCSSPLPLADFLDYARWYQRRAVPDIDPRQVQQISRTDGGFGLKLEDGERLRAARVVVATGIQGFAVVPAVFAGLPAHLVSHTSAHTSLRGFAGRRVVVVGGGQSALESAALLAERGAEVELVVRAPLVRWLGRGDWLRRRHPVIRHLFYPPTDVGPPGLNQIVARPDLFRRLPPPLQERIAYRSIRPAAAGWLRPRMAGVRFTTGRAVTHAAPGGGRIRLALSDGTVRDVHHVLLGTGYRVDVAQLPVLAPAIVARLARVNGYPVLGPGLRSSEAGLYFLGAPAAHSFGPLMRFVSGTGYAARALTRHVAGAERR
ncbi:MAG: FAD-dependent oxidoreductase [Candidatus Methylomirabilales bacterium]